MLGVQATDCHAQCMIHTEREAVHDNNIIDIINMMKIIISIVSIIEMIKIIKIIKIIESVGLEDKKRDSSKIRRIYKQKRVAECKNR